MTLKIPKEKVPQDKLLTYIVNETISRELPKELQKIDHLSGRLDRTMHNITCKILDVLNEELLAQGINWNHGFPSANFRGTVSEKVEKAFKQKFSPAFPTFLPKI